jgi:Ca2+-dependent lipid-binding protein
MPSLLGLPPRPSPGATEAGIKGKGGDSQEKPTLTAPYSARKGGEVFGKLYIKIMAGKLQRNTEMIGKMDPYVKIEFAGRTYRTHVISEGGQRPVWNDTFVLEVRRMSDRLLLTCLDEDFLSDDIVGSTSLFVQHLCTQQTTKQWLPVTF